MSDSPAPSRETLKALTEMELYRQVHTARAPWAAEELRARVEQLSAEELEDLKERFLAFRLRQSADEDMWLDKYAAHIACFPGKMGEEFEVRVRRERIALEQALFKRVLAAAFGPNTPSKEELSDLRRLHENLKDPEKYPYIRSWAQCGFDVTRVNLQQHIEIAIQRVEAAPGHAKGERRAGS